MKNKPLAMQIWTIFVGFIVIIAVLLGSIYSIVLKNFFTKEMYTTIENAQTLMFNTMDNIQRIGWKTLLQAKDIQDMQVILNVYQVEELQSIRSVNHFLLSENMTVDELPHRRKSPTAFFNRSPFPQEDLFIENTFKLLQQNASTQTERSKRYTANVDNKHIYYVMTKIENSDETVFLVSYMWDTYKILLVKSLLEILILIIAFLSLTAILVARIVSRRITAPLTSLECMVHKVAKKQWTEPINLYRNDEIGRLALSINKMQEELKKQDKEQQNFLQTISHDLKTPVMVIQSYVQALLDGIYLDGNYQKTIKVIEKESEFLEKKIKQLLYLTSLDYITERKPVTEKINLKNLMEDLISRFSFIRQDLNWSIQLKDIDVLGNAEQLKVLFENILDNQVRYAQKMIKISFSDDINNKIVITLFNDGPPIKEDVIRNIFKKFYKDKNGKFGLGLAIAKKIVDFHHGKIAVCNLENGVSFEIVLPIIQ